MNRVSAAQAAALLETGDEIALLDVREIMRFGLGHPLLATNLPLSRLEMSICDVVPRRATPILLIDGGDGRSELAAERLARVGYTDNSIVDGGTPAWEAAGLGLIPEIEVPTKGFGAFARINGKPNFISPNELKSALESDEDWIVLDSRPKPEYTAGNIPGSIDAPGADVLRWFDDLVPDPKTKVCVNCMSATRGILGGLSLIAAGVPNEVRVLHHGTRGWLLDGHELERGAARFPAPVSKKAQTSARKRAEGIAQRAGLPRIDRATLDAWRVDAPRTTYLFDVRTPEEFAAGHLPGARNAPDGSIIMSPDRYFSTLNARIVLADDDTVRATVTALWLAQMGWGDVAIYAGGIDGGGLESGPATDTSPSVPQTANITPDTLWRELEAGEVAVIDVGPSPEFVEAHIEGAAWCLRPELAEHLKNSGKTVVLTSRDGVVARYASDDIRRVLDTELQVLEGGIDAWRDAGLPIESGEENILSPRDDFFLASSERPGDQRQNIVDYLDWETGLLDDIERAGPVPYRNLIWA